MYGGVFRYLRSVGPKIGVRQILSVVVQKCTPKMARNRGPNQGAQVRHIR